jgi:hypothetical protein
MSVWASVADVEAVYEAEVPDRAQALLDRAEVLLKSLVPTIAARITADTLDPDLVRMTLVDAVIRVLRNPRGYSWEREGDYSYGLPLNVGKDGGTGGITFHPAELERLRPQTVSVGTITLGDPYKFPPFQRYAPALLDTWSDDPLHQMGSLRGPDPEFTSDET